eukprot:scaffold1193_cov126-Skeletonema_marinoi.AAC.3
MALNNDAGILSDKDFFNEVNIHRSFLMNWFGLDGSENDVRGTFYGARDAAVGVGLCNPHFGRAGTQMTANRIGDGITQQAVIFLRTFLKQDRFNALLTCCGKPTSRDNLSPLDDPSQREKWDKEWQREYRQRNREAHRQYYQDNHEDLLAYSRQYYQRNRARINEQRRAVREARLAQEILALASSQQHHQDNAEREQQRRESVEKKNAERKQQRLEQKREYRAVNRDRINERVQQRRETNKEKKARVEAELILKNAEVALTRYTELKKNGALQCLTNDVMKSLLAYIVPLHPLDEHDKPSKYKNGSQMRDRLGLCEKDCLSNYFSNEWKEKWLARILG